MSAKPRSWSAEQRRRYRTVFFAVFVVGTTLGLVTQSPVLYAITIIATMGYLWLFVRPSPRESTPSLFEAKDDERR